MRIGLSVYGTVFSMGIVASVGRPAITPQQLMDQAMEANLEGVEIPASLLKGQDVDIVARYARKHNLFVTLAVGGYDPQKLTEYIDLGTRLGVESVRTVVGGAKIGGDRRLFAGRWQAFLQEVLAGLQKATLVAERVGVNLAVENHQDVTSEELLWFCEKISSSCFGITLDTGNPLATAEEPLDFARRVAPYIKNVHLKDYHIYLSQDGYYLVRCSLGRGVIDFPALIDIFKEQCPNVTMSVELGALEARFIRVLAGDYWPEYPSRSASHFAQVMRFVLSKARPATDWRTPYERKETIDVITAFEEQELAESLAYIEKIRPLIAQ